MKIDPITKFISSIVPTKESDPASPLKDMPKLVKDVMEPFTSIVKTTNQTISTLSKNSEDDQPRSKKGDEETLERNMLKARMGGSQRKDGDDQVEKSKRGDDQVDKKKKGKKKDDGSGSTIFHDSDRVKDGKEVKYGDDVKGNLQKEISNISGIIDWKKGYTIVDKEAHLWRPIEFARELVTDKIGEASAKGRVDILAVRGRLFGLADLNWKKSLLELGLGAQGAFELIGSHIELRHDAPKILLGGVDAALHTVINGDAYVGAVAEGGAILNLSWDNFFEKSFLQLGGQAFAGAAASVSGSMSLGKLIGVRGTADGYAGVGAKAILKVGFENGKLDVESGLGAAAALGAGYDVGVSVNFLEIGKLAEGLGNQAKGDPIAFPTDFLQDVGHVLGSNLGSGLYLLDAAFHLTGKSDVPTNYERPGERDDVTERLDEKKNQKPAQPVA